MLQRMADLVRRAGLGAAGDGLPERAAAFIAGLETLVREVGLPTRLEALQTSDIPALSRAARHEADTSYPVPRYMTQAARGDPSVRPWASRSACCRTSSAMRACSASICACTTATCLSLSFCGASERRVSWIREDNFTI